MNVTAECDQCAGTGLYSGCAERRGTAVECLGCGGTGKMIIEYKPFTGRKPRSDIQIVRRSRGTSILPCGPTGSGVTYAEWLGGKRPQ